MDDITLAALEEKAVAAAIHIDKTGKPFGAYLNHPKTLIYSLDPTAPPPAVSIPGAQHIRAAGFDVGSGRFEDGTRVLGSPIGSKAFAGQYVMTRFETKYKPVFRALLQLNHPHLSWRCFDRLAP